MGGLIPLPAPEHTAQGTRARTASGRRRRGRPCSGTHPVRSERRRASERAQRQPRPALPGRALTRPPLSLQKCGLGSPEDFLSKALDPPQPQVISNAMHLLRKLGACEPSEPTLTPLGQHLAALPVNVKIGKMLVFGAILGCLDPVVRGGAAAAPLGAAVRLGNGLQLLVRLSD